MRESEGGATTVLANLNVEPVKVRSAVEFLISRGERPTPGGIGLTLKAKKVIELAVDEARQLDTHYIGTVHLLIGVLREGEGVAAGVLNSLGVTTEMVRIGIPGVREDRPKGNSGDPMPKAEWPEDLKSLAADLKRVQLMQNEAMSQQLYERVAELRDHEWELDRRFERRYTEWVRSKPDEPDTN